MYDYHCGRCGGLVPEPMKAYGYAGKWCHCKEPLPPKEVMTTTTGTTQEKETPTPKTVEEVVEEFEQKFCRRAPQDNTTTQEIERWYGARDWLRTTLAAQNQAARTAGYQAAVADLSGKPLTAIELMYDEAYARGYKEAEAIIRKTLEGKQE